MPDWLIKNAELVNEGRRFHTDLRIRGQRIDQIGADLNARDGEQVFDASGLWLLPGMIDDHVHFREPGYTAKADIASESRAAVAGGVTSFIDMPNTKPSTLTRELLEDKYAIASRTSLANYAFYFGASNSNLDAIRALDPRRVPGVKVFLCESTGNLCVSDPSALEGVFRDSPVTVVVHAEDSRIIHANLDRAKAEYGDAIPMRLHPEIRSREACFESTKWAVETARRHGTRLHVLHVSTADELAMFEPGPISGKKITSETCVHFLRFSDADYATLGGRIKCNPAIKAASDREALTRALADTRIDILATDHAPHLASEKANPYTSCPSGIPLVQFALQSALEGVFREDFSLERLVEAYAHAPATLFAIEDRGYLREGCFADLALVDPGKPQTVRSDQVLSKCGWSPFEGDTFRASIAATFVNGNLAAREGEVLDTPPGMRLQFDR
ncbi:MAG: dihydroorotase [Xanthomonadales bacterium]|nr:dihydroorotase [Xanthomonadales bacterium]ODU94878.1 MAG: dihydroorotase [Rhodanobacter sp. SCN 66-43]OJY82865.1 MAG: dihydroorotase [Xanthomonadales bacterium 66-474]